MEKYDQGCSFNKGCEITIRAMNNELIKAREDILKWRQAFENEVARSKTGNKDISLSFATIESHEISTQTICQRQCYVCKQTGHIANNFHSQRLAFKHQKKTTAVSASTDEVREAAAALDGRSEESSSQLADLRPLNSLRMESTTAPDVEAMSVLLDVSVITTSYQCSGK